MTLTPDIGWVEPATPIRGLDHLGVQAPCIALYTQLLPGITNVTNRARYYSFHPWLIWSFEHRYSEHSLDEFRRVLRRAECLFTLIAIRHARVAGDDDHGRHGAGMVGRLSLLRIQEDEQAIRLDDFADLEGPKRYFKNRLGGLGQYYFGPLRDLRILDHISQGEGAFPGYDTVRGVALAEALGTAVAADEFFDLLDASQFRWSDLDRLAEFCPCSLRTNNLERNLLLDLFLVRSEHYQSPESSNRRASLLLVLDLISRWSPLEGHSPEQVFLASAYGRALSDGTSWAVASSLSRAQHCWAVYEQNELFSLALQALFAAVLAEVEHNESGRLKDATAAGDVCVRLLPSAHGFRKRGVLDVVSELETHLPAMSAWRDDAHEMQRGWRILEAGTDDSKVLVEEGVKVLLSLLARGISDDAYSEFEFEPDYFDSRELHLLSFGQAWRSRWADMTIEEWVRWLVVNWGVQRHLGVALRKLRAERRDTFRIRPLEQELRVIEVPPPAATVPRLGMALQILRDLDLTDLDEDGWPTLTTAGRRELEAGLAS